MSEMFTQEEFLEHYSRGSGMSVEELQGLGAVAISCDCGEPNCRGWRMDMSEALSQEILRRLKRATTGIGDPPS
jgi:hypothetical protein